jgi:hypothetical protein
MKVWIFYRLYPFNSYELEGNGKLPLVNQFNSVSVYSFSECKDEPRCCVMQSVSVDCNLHLQVHLVNYSNQENPLEAGRVSNTILLLKNSYVIQEVYPYLIMKVRCADTN